MGVLRFLVIGFLLCCNAWAMPALGRVQSVRLPDGSTLNVRAVGNEEFNYMQTEDGYAVARDSLGFFCYLDETGSLTNLRARDLSQRTGSEIEFLSSLNREEAVRGLKNLRNKRDRRRFRSSAVFSETNSATADSIPAIRRMPKVDSNLNGGERKALVVLVQFSDVKFASADPKAEYEEFLKKEGYNVNNNVGSVRDYFKENSAGKFVPNFDVVGPITLNYPSYKTFGAYSSYGEIGATIALSYALDSLKAMGTVDFTQYDNDGDYELDFVHMIYAGVGSNDSKQDSAMWPHMWYLVGGYQYLSYYLPTLLQSSGLSSHGKAVATSGSGFRKKTYYVDAYACSNELDGTAWTVDRATTLKSGVGTFIHEFSHLMGLGDHYATDNSDTYTLANWDVMDGGAYNCPTQDYPIACSPPYYSAFERMSLGWMNPDEISEGDGVQLGPVNENVALKLTNPKNSDEFYLMEYRSRKGWDAGLPNHGMLIWHIDYDDSTWYYSTINTAEGLHVDIVEADGMATYSTQTGDVFPGTARFSKVTSFKKFLTCDGTDLDVSLTNISESNSYDYVTFNVKGTSEYVESSSSEMPEISSSSEEEISSSSEDIAESSSSIVEESSSSEITMPESSSSDVVVGISSSSEAVSESSSSEADIPEKSSDSSGEGLNVAGFAVRSLNVSREGGMLHITGLPQGNKVLRVFSLNGNLLMSRQVEGSDCSLEINRHFGRIPVIVQVSQAGRITRRLVR